MNPSVVLGKTGRRSFLAGTLAIPFIARADVTWPSRPIRIVVPFNPGGAMDAMARVLGEALTLRLGQPVLIDPKPGANTIVGSEIVTKAAPDGYTFLLTTNTTHTNNPALYARLPFDPARDLAPVSLVSLGSVLIAVKGDAGFNDLRGMAAWVKSLGRPATYGSTGIGSPGHLYGLMLEKTLGSYYNHVPYRGDVPALKDVAKGTLDMAWASPVSVKSQMAAGHIKPIAAAGAKRSAAMPDIATFAEQLVAGFDLSLFVAAYAPAGTPPEIVERMQHEMRFAVASSQVTGKLVAQGQTPLGSTSAELAAVLQREVPLWAELIRQSGARSE